MSSPTVNQTHYQFQLDGADANTSTLIGAEDVPNGLLLDTTYFVRIKVSNTGTKAASGYTYQLEYNVGGAGWNSVTTASSNVRAVDGSDTDGDAMSTERLTNDGGTYTNGVYEESGITGSFDLSNGNETELVYAIQFRSADLTAGGENIDLRVTNGGSTIDNYNVTVEATMPAINTVGITNFTVGTAGAQIDLVYFIPPASPWFGTVNFSGFAATVAISSGNEIDVTGQFGQVNVEGFAPDVDLIRTIDGPAVGITNFSGFAPTVDIERTVSSQLGEVYAEGFAPTVDIERTVTSTVGEVNWEGFAGTVTKAGEFTAVIQVGNVYFVGFAPTADVTSAAVVSVEEPDRGAGSGHWDEVMDQILKEDSLLLDLIREFIKRVA